MISVPSSTRPETNLDVGAPLQRRSLPQAVAVRLQHLIREKKIPNGSRLPSEKDLSIALGASRSVVREGVRILEGLGTVIIRHGKGIFVLDSLGLPLPDHSQLDSSQRVLLIRQAIEARRCIEVEVATAAARAATTADLSQLQAFLDEAERLEFWTGPHHNLNLEFEMLLGIASHNDYLIALQKMAHRMFISTVASADVMQRLEFRRDHLRKILVAVQFGNADRAAEQTADYFQYLLNGITR